MLHKMVVFCFFALDALRTVLGKWWCGKSTWSEKLLSCTSVDVYWYVCFRQHVFRFFAVSFSERNFTDSRGLK